MNKREVGKITEPGQISRLNRVPKKKFIYSVYESVFWQRVSFLTSGRTPGPFLSQRSRSLLTLKRRRATFMSPIRHDKQMARCLSIVPPKLLLLSAHLQLAKMKRKYGPIANPAVVQRLNMNSPRMSYSGSSGRVVMAVGIDRKGFMER